MVSTLTQHSPHWPLSTGPNLEPLDRSSRRAPTISTIIAPTFIIRFRARYAVQRATRRLPRPVALGRNNVLRLGFDESQGIAHYRNAITRRKLSLLFWRRFGSVCVGRTCSHYPPFPTPSDVAFGEALRLLVYQEIPCNNSGRVDD